MTFYQKNKNDLESLFGAYTESITGLEWFIQGRLYLGHKLPFKTVKLFKNGQIRLEYNGVFSVGRTFNEAIVKMYNSHYCTAHECPSVTNTVDGAIKAVQIMWDSKYTRETFSNERKPSFKKVYHEYLIGSDDLIPNRAEDIRFASAREVQQKFVDSQTAAPPPFNNFDRSNTYGNLSNIL